MSAISLKSITGITSITTPAGVDNQLTLHTNNTAERFRINSDGKVGFGTTGSDYALSIREADNNNKFLMLQKNSGQELLQVREDGNNHIIFDGSHASGELHFYTAGDERLRILSNGNISVGSNGAAAEKFQVNSGSIAIVGGGSYKIDTHPLVSYASFTDISGGTYAARLGSTGTSTIRSTQIYGGGGHIATFDGVNKRLGINNTVPQARLHVVGGTASGTAYDAAVFAGGQNSTSGSGVKLYLTGCENDPLSRGVILESIMTDNSNAHRFSIKVSGSSAAPTEKLRIDSSGRVIIANDGNGGTADVNADNFVVKNTASNTSCGISILNADNQNATLYFGNASDSKHAEIVWSDASNLFLIGSSNAGASIKFRTANQSDALLIDSNGKMGLGTNNPQRLLHLQSTGDTLARITSADGSAAYLELGDVSDPDGGKIVYDSGSNLTFYSASSERLRITSTGKVGIGTDNPRTGYLHVGPVSPQPGSAFSAPLTTYATGALGETKGNDNKIATFAGRASGNVSGLSLYHFRERNGTNYTTDGFSFRQEVDNTENVYEYMNFTRGKIGIGTMSPSKQVHIEGTIPFLRLEDATVSSKRLDLFVENSDGYIGANQSAQKLHLQTTTVTRLTIDSSGRSLFKTNGSQTTPVADNNVPVQIAESTGGYCYFGANKGNSYGSIFGHHTHYGGTVIRNLTSDNIVFMTNNNAERLRITSGGTTISTITSPDPYNTVNENIRIVNSAGNQGAGSKIRFATANANAHIESRITGGNSNSGTSLNFATSPANSDAEECLRITPSGNILQRARPYSNTYQNPGWGMGRYVKSGWLMAQSSFSNPTMDLVDLLDNGNAYQNLFIKVTAMQIRFRGSNNPEGQIHTGYASAKRDVGGTNTWYAYVGTMQLENAASGFNSGTNVGTLSWSASNNFDTATLRYTGNRQDNYDTYQVCVEVWSNNNDSLAFKLSSGYLA